MLYEGCRTYWKVRANLDVTIVEHHEHQVIEVIAFDPQCQSETPRLYVDSALADRSLNMTTFYAKLQEEKEKLIRQRSSFNEQDLSEQIALEMKKDFLLSRLQVRAVAGDQPWCIYLQPNFCDIVDPVTGLFDFLLAGPTDEMTPMEIPRATFTDPRKWDATMQQFQQLVTAKGPSRRASLVPLLPLFPDSIAQLPAASPSIKIPNARRSQCWTDSELSDLSDAAVTPTELKVKVLVAQPSDEDVRSVPQDSRAHRALLLAKHILEAQDVDGELLFQNSSPTSQHKLIRSTTCASELTATSSDSSRVSTPTRKRLTRSATNGAHFPHLQGSTPRHSERLDRAVFKSGDHSSRSSTPMNSARSAMSSPRGTTPNSARRNFSNIPHCAELPTISSARRVRDASPPAVVRSRRETVR